MVVDSLDEAPPNVEDVVVEWLAAIGPAGVQRMAVDPLPYREVHRIAGADDPDQGIDVAVVSVHTFASDMRAAKTEADLTHQRMLWLTRHPFTDIELVTGVANINFCQTVEKPANQGFGDPKIGRYVARYRIGVDFVRGS